MSKTNFTKVEEALNEGLRKISVRNLLKEADEGSKKGKKVYDPGKLAQEEESTEKQQVSEVHSQMIASLQREFKIMEKNDPGMFVKLGIKRHRLKKMMANQATLTDEDWDLIRQVKVKVDQYKRAFLKRLPKESDDNIVNKERKKHINKRFNINDNWLPLT